MWDCELVCRCSACLVLWVRYGCVMDEYVRDRGLKGGFMHA